MKRLFCIPLVIVLLTGALAGCGDGDSSVPESGVSNVEISESAPAEVEEPAPAEPTPSEEPPAQEMESVEPEEEGPVLTAEQQALIDLIPEGEFLTFQTYPLTEEPETLSLFYSMHPLMTQYYTDAADIPIFGTVEEMTGVHIEFNTVSFMAVETVAPLLIASGDMNDIMPVANYTDSPDAAVEQDLIYDLTDLIADYAPNYKGLIDGNSRFGDTVTTADGRIVGFSMYSMDNTRLYIDGPEIRMDWLEKCGLDIPVTVDDYYEMLTAFKNQIGCESPMWLHYSGINDDNQLTRAYGIDGTDMIVLDGKVTSSLLQPGFQSYLEMMHKWYSEGLVEQDFFSVTSEEPELAVVADDTYGLFYQYASEYPELYGYASDPDFEIQAITDAVLNEGDKLLVSNGMDSEATPGGNFNITTACGNVELALKWLDFFYSPDGWLLCNYGTEGETFNYDENGIPHWTEVISGSEMPGLVAKSTYTMLQWSFLFDASREFDGYTDEMIEASDIWASVEADDGYINLPVYVTLSSDVSNEINAIESDIDTYVDECLVKFIIGDMDLENGYDAFVSQLEAMGIQTMLDAYQDAYDTITAARGV